MESPNPVFLNNNFMSQRNPPFKYFIFYTLKSYNRKLCVRLKYLYLVWYK